MNIKFLFLTALSPLLLVSSPLPGEARVTGGIDGLYDSPAVERPAIRLVAGSVEPVAAKTGSGAHNYVENMGQRALAFLGNENLSLEQKTEEFRKLLKDSFDMETIGRFALGRYWRTATAAQKKEYQALFQDMIVNVYSQRFREYKGQRFETRSWRPEGEKDIVVTSFIIPETGPEIQIDWRVRHKGGRYQIIDVIVEGVSMSVTQRSDFASVIQRGGGDVQVLIDHLKLR